MHTAYVCPGKVPPPFSVMSYVRFGRKSRQEVRNPLVCTRRGGKSMLHSSGNFLQSCRCHVPPPDHQDFKALLDSHSTSLLGYLLYLPRIDGQIVDFIQVEANFQMYPTMLQQTFAWSVCCIYKTRLPRLVAYLPFGFLRVGDPMCVVLVFAEKFIEYKVFKLVVTMAYHEDASPSPWEAYFMSLSGIS